MPGPVVHHSRIPGPLDRRITGVVRAGILLLAVSGCQRVEGQPLVVATAWPPAVRRSVEADYRRESGDPRPITWVVLGSGDRPSSVLGRRGGVDLLLGGSILEASRLAGSGRLAPIDPSSPAFWRVVRKPELGPSAGLSEGQGRGDSDPRDDPSALSSALATLRAEGWSSGYESLVRRAARRDRQEHGAPIVDSLEALSLPAGSSSPDRARRLVAILEARGLAGPPTVSHFVEATADDLLADLLGSALVDSLEELRDADAALRRFDHPPRAEAAIGERPPWPPASVLKLRASPDGGALLETLAEQVAPDPEARAWLLASWSRPRRALDGDLLAELAGAAEGRLAREPRFRAWLRGEWTAWTRQLYRRVARLAGGYVPS